jgi:hypothetical protein
MTYGLGATAGNLLDLPYQGSEPFAPAGITDLTRQGWATQLQGLAGQGNVANQYAGQFNNFNPNSYTPGTGGGNPYAQLGGQINQVGNSFNPWNPMLMNQIQQANQQLGRDFNQSVMPQLNRGLVGSGPGAYGGTRAGIAQGIREQGLADAMQRQTTQMAGQGYEAGLGRYVQDRGNTFGAISSAQNVGAVNARTALNAQQYGAGLAGQGAGYLTDIGNQLSRMGGAQQQANQGTIDWYNRQFVDSQNMPWARFNNYSNTIKPITTSGATGQTNVSTGEYVSPVGSAIGGGFAGYGFGQEQWPSTTNPYTGGGGGSYDPRLDPNVTHY